MGVKGLVALATATIALLLGPGTALAQDEGTSGAPAASTGVDSSAVVPEQEPASTPSDDTSTVAEEPSDAGTSSAVAEDPSTDAAAETVAQESSAGSAPAEAIDQSQPQVEASVLSVSDVRSATTSKKSSDSCGLATASATPRRVGPPGTGCTRVDGGQISKDPANPTVLPPINGVTVAIWIVDTPSGPEVHYKIQSGSFSGTDAIDLKVKGGPDPNGFTCQVTNANITTEGICHAPVNPNNGKFYGVSHVDACPGSTTSPPVNPPPGGTGGVAGEVGKGGEKGQQGVAGTVGVSAPAIAAPAVAGAAAGGAAGLPVTGLAVLWLFLIGGALLTGGALARTRLN